MQIEGNNAKADDAIMLDQDGYLSETNATNIVCLSKFIEVFLFEKEHMLFSLLLQNLFNHLEHLNSYIALLSAVHC